VRRPNLRHSVCFSTTLWKSLNRVMWTDWGKRKLRRLERLGTSHDSRDGYEGADEACRTNTESREHGTPPFGGD
jgi:hypothetical protein